MNRYAQALLSQSATNPVGLTNSLLRYQQDLLDEGASTDQIKKDPACRLLAFQLSWLFDTTMSDTEYTALLQEAEDKAKEATA